MKFLLLIFSLSLFAQAPESLEDMSRKINLSLPEKYDHMTKLLRTRVENNVMNFDFLVNATKEEFAAAFPKVKGEVLKTVCHHSREGLILKAHKKAIIYRYENLKGQSLGEFMISPQHCTN
jgi:hypothetical protein